MKSTKKIPKTFISFLLLSLLIWLLITFSKEYSTTVAFPVKYTELPQNRLLQKEPIKELDILVKGSGFKILTNKFNTNSILLNIDNLGKKSNSKYFFLPVNQKVSIQKQLLSGLQIEQILKDTINLEIGVLTSKKVPVIPNLKIKYHVGYDASKELIIEPDSILISGTEELIKNIKSLKTSFLELEDVKGDFNETVSILKPENSENINFNKKTVLIKGSVEKYTEGSFQIPFIVTNLPSEIQINTLAKTVEIVYIVGLSDFNKIESNSFRVECNYLDSKENNLGYLIPKIVTKPTLVKNVKIIPNKIDFLIQK